MSSLKDLKLAQKLALQQRQTIQELETLVKDIERCEKTITDLKFELEAVNRRHQNRRTTRDDVDYLTDLLKCANKKLVWEKHIGSLQKRTPAVLESVSTVINDPQLPENDPARLVILRSLQTVQAAMARLQMAEGGAPAPAAASPAPAPPGEAPSEPGDPNAAPSA
jgi:hypothetical protein